MRSVWVFKTPLDKGERKGGVVFDFRSENGRLVGS